MTSGRIAIRSSNQSALGLDDDDGCVLFGPARNIHTHNNQSHQEPSSRQDPVGTIFYTFMISRVRLRLASGSRPGAGVYSCAT
jgi:hypothetical protein